MQRLFPDLDPLDELPDDLLRACAEAMREPAGQAFDNPSIAAGYTYLGQFADHDVTAPSASSHGRERATPAQASGRAAWLDLDSLYGAGPEGSPWLYDPSEYHGDPTTRGLRFLVDDAAPATHDLPRDGNERALVGDPRNDENTILSQLTVAFLELHNRIFGDVYADPDVPPEKRFEETRRQVRWHYQWALLEDFLPLVVDPTVLAERYWRDGDGVAHIELPHYDPDPAAPAVPVEFSAAAFRFGHSMVRSSYDLNGDVRDLPIFVPGNPAIPSDLRGERRLPPGWQVEWPFFFGETAQRSHLIDTRLSRRLFTLPLEGGSLPYRDLVSGQYLGLPSGQDVAKAVGAPVLPDRDLGWAPSPTPLWLYLLRESEVVADGRRLGPAGGTIVAEVLLGLVAFDPGSWYSSDPAWTPSLPDADGDGRFTAVDLLAYATG